MLNKYEVEVFARCPVTPSCVDVYAFTIETERVIEVEKIIAFFFGEKRKPVFQEALTRQCAVALGVRVTSVGYHSGVKVTSTAP